MMEYITKVEEGMKSLKVGESYKKLALENIGRWLRDAQFQAYKPQLTYLIDSGRFDLLLDCFYQVLPFGTGGRRGPVGIGPNRINPWTIQASAQGHSDFLLKMFGEEARKRGIVICYDVRKYPKTDLYASDRPNPFAEITSRQFALCAAQVYTANGIKCYLFEDVRSTPQLSFAIRHLKTVAGVVISASHNPKEDNGKKVYSDDGGQLLAPEDQRLSDVVNSVQEIKVISVEEARSNHLLDESFTKSADDAYIQEVISQSLARDIDKKGLSIVYSPLHGVGLTSVYKALTAKEFEVTLDPATARYDGFFPNVKFNIPNPEVVESMETLIEKGKSIGADLLISSDPDADRLGLMAKVEGGPSPYRYFNGNEIGILLTHFVLEERKQQGKLPEAGVVVKTTVTSELIAKIAREFGMQVIGELLVGFKYIAHEIKKMEREGHADRFVIGMEESHGFLVGTYCRDKDAAGAALLLAELACRCKAQGKTIADYLDDLYTRYGYYSNKQTSLIFLGAEGKEKIDKISADLRQNPPAQIGDFQVIRFVDRWKDGPIVSPTDESSRNVLSFFMDPPAAVEFIKITVRPSGTEPKIKIYIEVGGRPLKEKSDLPEEKERLHRLTNQVLNSFTREAYRTLGISMPERGFKLSNLLPVELKLTYFEVEERLLSLEREASSSPGMDVKKRVDECLAVFGKDPIEKISEAFKEKTGMGLRQFLKERLSL